MMNKIFGGQNAEKAKMKDYGNISASSDNVVDELIDDLYNLKHAIKSELPLDIIDENKTDKSNDKMNNSDDIDLCILTKVLIPRNILFNEKNNQVWTFDSILTDLKSTFEKDKLNK
eukprot:367233_1